MSLISQNAVIKDEKKRRRAIKKKDEIPVEELNGNIEDGSEVAGDGTSNIQKRKRGRKKSGANKMIEDEKMKTLEQSLFGTLYNPVKFGKYDEDAIDDDFDTENVQFFTDRSADGTVSLLDEDSGGPEEANHGKPVWFDEEEETITVNIAKGKQLRKLRKDVDETVISGSAYVSRLRAYHVKMNPGTEWSQPEIQRQNVNTDGDSDEEDTLDGNGNGILRTNEDLVLKRSCGKLLPGALEYSRMVDANVNDPSDAPIHSVQFHKNGELLLVGGLDKTLRFFQIDGKKNEVVQSVFLEDFPIRKAVFLPDGSQAVVAGRRRIGFAFDLVKARIDKFGPFIGRDDKSLESFEVSPDSSTIAFLGSSGNILLVSSKTKQLIGTLKMNATVRSAAFSHDGRRLASSGGDGRIYLWDVRKMRCVDVVVDEGCVKGTALCGSHDGRWLAAGSESGIVNVYGGEEFFGNERDDDGKKKKKGRPVKVIENLTTRVDTVKFNWDAQILAIVSRMKRNSMRLVHVASMTVFQNFPRQNQSLGYPICVDFSPRGFMAVGNAAGKVPLFKLHHY
ncbi:hypothetical protein M569_00455, partial [Genlisea aurea]